MWEWNEALVFGTSRGLRGGPFHYSDTYLHAADRSDASPWGRSYYVGFRVAQVPEPATVSLLLIGSILAMKRRQ